MLYFMFIVTNKKMYIINFKKLVFVLINELLIFMRKKNYAEKM